MPAYDVRLKQVDPLLVATIREIVSIEDDLEQRYETISTYLDQQGVQHTQPHLLLRYSRYELHDDGMYADVELAVPLHISLPGNELVSVHKLPGGLMACTVHTGDELFLGQAYVALHRWMEDNGYSIIGPPRQLHLQRAEHTDPRHSVIELQFPVKQQDV